MRYRLVLLAVTLLAFGLNAESLPFYKGADVSSLLELEAAGVSYRDGGEPEDAIAILKDHGVNSIRLRLWHTPDESWNGLAQTINLAQRVKAAGLHLLLDIHYSDWWADPGSQTPPTAWEDLNAVQITDSVYTYTFDVMTCLQDANALPDMVQIGNEIGCGMLWPHGAVCGTNNTADQWQNLADFLNAGSQAVHDVAGEALPIMIHDFRGGDSAGASWFFSNLNDYGVDYDIIGLSYYPWWHGSLDDLAANMGNLAYYHEKPVIVVETAYPWTLGWNDDTNNIIGLEEQLLPGYTASPEGQALFLQDLMGRIENTWQGYGKGVYYWEPVWTSGAPDGSPWENLALFDFDGSALSALDVFQDPVAISPSSESTESRSVKIFPNPSNRASLMQFYLDESGQNHLTIYSLRGEVILERHFSGAPGTRTSWQWRHINTANEPVPAGLYVVKQTGVEITSQKILILN